MELFKIFACRESSDSSLYDSCLRAFVLKKYIFWYYKCTLLSYLHTLLFDSQFFLLPLTATWILDFPIVPGWMWWWKMARPLLGAPKITYPIACCHCSLDVPRVHLTSTLKSYRLTIPSPLTSKLTLFCSTHTIYYLCEYFIIYSVASGSIILDIPFSH